jgi:hypothetical protein
MRSPTKILHSGTPETYGSYSIKTEMDGRYSVCFENPSASIQKVSFNFLGQDPTISSSNNFNNFFNDCYVSVSVSIAPNDKPDQIQNELQDLNSGLKFIQNEQDYMIQREKIHRQSINYNFPYFLFF